MNAVLLVLALLAASADDAAPAAAPRHGVAKDKKPKKGKAEDRDRAPHQDKRAPGPGPTSVSEPPPFSVKAAASVGAGAMTGRTSYATPAALTVVSASVTPTARWAIVELTADLDVAHEETWGASLRESQAQASLAAELRPWRELRTTAQVGAAGVSRPGWPDPYQPVDDDPSLGLLLTDRGSHLDLFAQARALWIPAPHQFLRARYRFTRVDSLDDPAFDAINRPNHLTPFDNDEHVAELSWRAVIGLVRPGLTLGGSRQDWFFVFSRDAGTGATHVGEGGDPANPLQAENALELEPELELEVVRDELAFKLAWRMRAVDDPWQGYLSRLESRLRFDAEWHVGPRDLQLGLDGRVEVSERLYGDAAYAAGPDHPPLDWGDRREARAAAFALRGRFPDRQPLQVYVALEGSAFLTNFPDYVAGVFPASQAYDLKRDYRHVRALVGVEIALDR